MTRIFCEGEAQFGDWVSHVAGWRRAVARERLLLLSYEQLQADCAGALARVLRFLGLGARADPARLAEVAAGAAFSRMRARDLQDVPGSASFRARAALRDPAVHFLREGRAGAWCDELSARNAQQIHRYLDQHVDEDLRSELQKLGVL